MKTLLNNLWAHIGYEDDGHLVHTDKRTGAQRVSLQNAFEPMFEPKSLLPGNGIFKAETKRPKRLRRFKDAVAETKSR